MLSSPVAVVVTLVFVAVVGVVVVAVVSAGLAISGGPGDCTPGGGPISVSAANAQAFQLKWDAFDQLLDAGSPSSVSFSESEVSSRADQFVREETDVDVDDLRVCFHDGFAEVSGKLNSGIGINSEVRIRGSVDLSSDRSRHGQCGQGGSGIRSRRPHRRGGDRRSGCQRCAQRGTGRVDPGAQLSGCVQRGTVEVSGQS